MFLQLTIYMGETPQEIQVPAGLTQEASAFFDKMDTDMDKGFQMSRTWVPNPDTYQRCQIVSDRILSAITNGKKDVCSLMAAYILNRMPFIQAIDLNLDGDMTQHELISLQS